MSAPNSTKRINAAILGTGMSLTVFHHPLLVALPELYNVHTVMERSGKQTCRNIVGEGVKIVSTLEEVLADQEVDLVVVSTPNPTHWEYVKRSLEAGKHVMCEKPLVPTAKQAEELFRIAKEKKRILGVYQNRRFDGDFLTVQKLIKEGTLGPILDITSSFDRFKPPVLAADIWKERPGGYNDAIYNLGSHMIDQVIVLFGKPKSVTCRSWEQRGIKGIEEAYTMDLEYPPQPGSPSPLYVTTRSFILSPITPQLRFQVRGLTGSYIKHDVDPQEGRLKAGKSIQPDEAEVETEEQKGTVWRSKEVGKVDLIKESYPTQVGNYCKIYQSLAEAILADDQSKFVVSPEEAILNIRLIEAGLQSSKERRTIDIE